MGMILWLFAIFLIGVPICFSLGFVSLGGVLLNGFPPLVVVQRMFTGADSIALIAIPLFMLAGELMFQGKPAKNIRAVASLYPEHIQAVVTKESGIKSIADLKGKRVGIGAPGSGVEGDVQAIFKVAGLTYDDLAKADFLDFAATTSRFKDNQIDAGFVVAGYPTASIMDLTTTKDVTLLSFDDEMLATLQKEYPFFVPCTERNALGRQHSGRYIPSFCSSGTY